jgi:hypothetical protein
MEFNPSAWPPRAIPDPVSADKVMSMQETSVAAVPKKKAVAAVMEPSMAPLWRLGGFALLILALIDLVESLIPPQFMNPTWELQFMGTLIERSPVPLLGFLFVFFAEFLNRTRRKRLVAISASWLSLAAGIVVLLMVPLIITNTFRVERRTTAQLNAQLEQQLAQTQAVDSALRSAAGENLEALLRKLGRTVDGAVTEQLRAEALEEVAAARRTLQDRAEDAKAAQKLSLTKRSYKWSAQALVVGGLLMYLWFGTGWIRKGQRWAA